MYGLATDWPIEWAELERYYGEAERRLNVAGEPSRYPEDRRSAPYPQGPIPLSYNLQTLKTWAEQLNDDQAAQLLEETLNEEKKADQKLTQIAESSVNTEAAAAASARAGSRR